MSCILSVYSISAFKEFFLPEMENGDSSITVGKMLFDLSEDVVIPLEAAEGRWYIREMGISIAYTILQQKYTGEPLKNGDLLMITLPEGQALNIIVRQVAHPFIVYRKYDISTIDTIRIGKSEDCDIRYDFLNLLSKEHGIIRKAGDIYTVEDTGENGIFINHLRIAGVWQLSFGDHIDIFGLHMVFLGEVLAINAGLEKVTVREDVLPLFHAGKQEENAGERTEPFLFHRSPRKLYRIESDTIEIEEPPVVVEKDKQSAAMITGPAAAMALPMILGCCIAIYSVSKGGESGAALLFAGMAAAIGTLWSLVNIYRIHSKNREKEQCRLEAYGEYLVQCARSVKEKYDKNTEALREMYPPSEVCCRYNETSTELWNRNSGHKDMLFVRLGLGDIPFQVTVNTPKGKLTMPDDILAEKPERIKERYRMLHEVPVGIDLLKYRLVGIFGGEKKKGAITVLYNMVAQIAANNCYTDVKLAFVYDANKYDDSSIWNFAKWLPHVWSEDKKTRYVAENKAEAGDIFYELTKVLRSRHKQGGRKLPKPYYVLFIADQELLEGEMLSEYIFEPKEEYGLTTILLEENYEQLPNACAYLIQNDTAFTGIYGMNDDIADKLSVKYDAIAESSLEELGRRLSNIEVNEIETGGEITDLLTFFEMYKISRPEELKAGDRWDRNRTYESMKAPIGCKAGGTACYLDVHEKYHGPHGLVVGTTGSGKSEILQTYILSMAINFSPDDVCFFVIDYKGGGMANPLSGLPHMIGQVSNLSGSQVHRAMVSIKSENKRRQRIFNEYGVNNINLYTRLYKNGEAKNPLPHLFIIIDEFAELKREEPEFMGELISVAQVGRSLGVHLILATQKPGGTIDDNIRSNSRFKLCLRVQDGQDSEEVLHKPDAAYITQPGRCYLQVGNDEVYELFQTGYSGAAYDEEEVYARTDIACMLSNTGKKALIGNLVGTRRKREEKNLLELTEKTQLYAVVEYLDKTAKEKGYGQSLQLWMPELPKELYLEELEDYMQTADESHSMPEKEEKWGLNVAVGLCDDPANQAQMPLVMDLAANGHYAVCGMVVSGKSTFLQTFMYAMICKYTPDEVNLYGIDFGSCMLRAFEQAPHVGGIIYDKEEDRLAKFVTMLSGILEERKVMFRGGNYSQYVQANGVTVPAIVVVLDNFAGFRSKTDNKYDDFFIRLSKDGADCGVYIVLTAGGFGTLEIPSSIGDNFRSVISLEMGDKFQYAAVMRTMHVDVLPEENVKGRGLVRSGDSMLEFQTALALRAEDDFKRSEEIAKRVDERKKSWSGKCAVRIPEIPKNFIFTEFAQNARVREALQDDRHLPIGYDAESVEVYGVDLSHTHCFLLGGKARTGKTNMLRVLLSSAALKGGKIAVIDFEGELEALHDKVDMTYLTDDEALYSYLKDILIPAYRKRNEKKRTLASRGLSDEEIYVSMKEEEKIFIFIADLPEFIRHIYSPAGGVGRMEAAIENFWDKGSCHSIFWFGCLRTEDVNMVLGKKAYELFAGYGKGAYFGGNVVAQKILNFDDMPYMEQLKSEKPGIAVLPATEDETIRKVAVPLYKS